MNKFLFFTAITLTLSQSLAFAMLDEDFSGDTLVIGGETRNQPHKLSVNIAGSDIIGSGWNTEFLEKNFTKGKYTKIVYEHVGHTLAYAGEWIGQKKEEARADAYHLAKIHFDLLQPGGTFDFFSYGYVYDKLSEETRRIVGREEGIKFNPDAPRESMGSINCTTFFLKPDELRQYNFKDYQLVQAFLDVNTSYLLLNTVQPLAKAGFQDIWVKHEKYGDSLHISAKKPE